MLGGLAIVGFAAMLQFGLPSVAVASAVDDVGEGVAAFVAAGACAWAASGAAGRSRTAWFLMAISATAWGVGEAIWSIYRVGLHVAVPFPSLADVGYVIAIPFAFAAIVMFWERGGVAQSWWRVLLDGLIVFLALTFTAWAVGLKTVWQDAVAGGSSFGATLAAAYPLGDLLIGTVVILGIRRATRSQQARMLLLLGGIACYTLADSAFSYLAANGLLTARGTVLNTGWFAGYLFIALAALWPSPQVAAAEHSPYDFWQIALPWVAVVSAGVSAFAIAASGRQLDSFLTALVGLGASLLVVSMVLAQRDSFVALATSRQSEAALAEVIARAPSGVARIGADMRVIDANPHFAALMHAEGSQGGRPVRSYFRGEVASQFIVALRGLRDGTDSAQDDIEVRRADGSTTWVHWSAAAVEGADGEPESYVAMFEDTTARHLQDAAAAASVEVLERLNRLKSEFLQGVSHEFKTALLGIQGFSEFIRDADELDVKDARVYAADIYSDAERLDRMVTEMVALDRVESSRALYRTDRVDLDAVIRREAGDARGHVPGSQIVLNIQDALPAVVGDKSRLSEVVHTLIENAIQRSPEGGVVTIAAWASGSGVEVSVKDQGVGARAEFDNRLFDDDDLYANNPIRRVVGTGLGLGISRRVVEMHGGRFWVEGGGSELHFSVPVLWKDHEATAG